MADRGRDLKVSILSDAEKFDLTKPSQELEQLSTDAKTAGDGLDQLATNAKDTARKVDTAFDQISTSSKAHFNRRVTEDVEGAKHKLGEFKDEAHQSAREAAASFSGAATDVQSLGQEILANAPAAFGAAGGAIGVALASGFGLLYQKWTETKQKIKQEAGEIAQALVDTNGIISESFIDNKLQQFLQDGTLQQLAKQADDAGVSVRDFQRAVAGDPKAIERVNRQLNESQHQFNLNAAGSINAADAISVHNKQLDAIRKKLGITTEAVDAGTASYQLYKQAVEQPVVPKFQGNQAAQDADNYRARLEAAARRPVVFTASLDTSKAYQDFRQMERDFTNGNKRPRP